MLFKLIPALRNSRLFYWLNKFWRSPFHIAIAAILITISAMFDVGFVCYYILMGICLVIPSLFADDMTALIPLAVMLNIGISKELKSTNTQIVMGENIQHFVIFLIAVIVFAFGRLIFDLATDIERRERFPRLLIGYIAITVAFCMGGLFSSYNTINDFSFGLREALALGGFYFYFFYTVDFSKMKGHYFAYLLFFFAFSVAIQIVVEANRSGLDTMLEVGWGNRSGLGGTLVAAYTGVVYLIIKRKACFAWIYMILFFFFLTMIGITQCRGAALTAMVMLIPSVVLITIFGSPIKRIVFLLILVIYFITMVSLYFTEPAFFTLCFGRLFNFDFNTWDDFSSHRITIWKTGLDQFAHNPICGVGWYQIPDLGFQARYHNTAIQLLAATGIFGTVCYLVHRGETLIMTFQRPTLEKSIAFMSILCILLSSLLDCFLFNIWLGFEYGFLLAFIEGRDFVPVEDVKPTKKTKPGTNVYHTKTGGTTIIINNR